MGRLMLALIALGAASGVTPVPVGPLLQHKANYFDLQHKLVRFTPSKSAYKVRTAPSKKALRRGRPVAEERVQLPFPFPFGGRKWNELYVNRNGNLTFDAPETAEHPQRATWSDGTMRSFAALADVAAVEGRQHMIAPLWAMYSETTRMLVTASNKEFIVTWDAERYLAIDEGYAPLGRNAFQVRLTPDGSIEFAYGDVAERDGVVGVFTGLPSDRPVLDSTQNVVVGDAGSGVHFRMANAPKGRVVAYSGNEGYSITLDGETASTFCFEIDKERQGLPMDCPVAIAARSAGNTLEFYVPKIGLRDASSFSWKTDTIESSRHVKLRSGIDFTGRPFTASGSICEAFHYPAVTKSRMPAFRAIHQRLPARADLAIVFTDFRIDDVHNHGGSNRAQNRDESMALFGSERQQSGAGPIYLGPRFSETARDDERTYRNYAFGVGWMAHEMAHRWAAYLRWDPKDEWALLDSTRTHWNELVHTPVVAPVSHLFTDTPYPEQSVMGGMTVAKEPDGRMSARRAPWLVASGLCALDLYLMGLMEPGEVSDTFFISAPQRTPEGGYTGGRDVPLRIADIIRYNGPRTGPVRRELTLGIYLLHEDGRPPHPDKLAQARGLGAMLIRWFDVATRGRVKVVAVL